MIGEDDFNDCNGEQEIPSEVVSILYGDGNLVESVMRVSLARTDC